MSTLTNNKNKVKMAISDDMCIYMPSLKADYQSQFLLSLHLKNIYLLSIKRHLILYEKEK